MTFKCSVPLTLHPFANLERVFIASPLEMVAFVVFSFWLIVSTSVMFIQYELKLRNAVCTLLLLQRPRTGSVYVNQCSWHSRHKQKRKYNKHIVHGGNVCFQNWLHSYQIDDELLILRVCTVAIQQHGHPLLIMQFFNSDLEQTQNHILLLFWGQLVDELQLRVKTSMTRFLSNVQYHYTLLGPFSEALVHLKV